MPYKIAKGENGQACVHKLNPDGTMGAVVKCHPTPQAAMQHMKALYANVPESARLMGDALLEREYSTELRKQYAKQGIAMPDGSYPIPDKAALSDAIQAYGRSPDEATKRHIMKRARALGATAMLPEKWTGAKKEESVRSTVLHEPITLAESAVDDELMAVRGVTLIRAGFSTNVDRGGRKRYYPPETLRASVPAFEGAVVHVNHPGKDEAKDLPEGDALGVRGWYEGVHYDEARGALVGDQLLVNRRTTREELWPIIKAAAEHKPDLIELSINAVGTTRLDKVEGEDSVVVEIILKGTRPNRIDIVTAGAAGGSYAGAALTASDDEGLTEALLGALSFEQWRAAQPGFVERLKAEWKTVREGDELKNTRAELEEARSEVQRLTEANQAEISELAQLRREKQADGLLSESGLPYRLRPMVREEMLAQADEAGMKAVLVREQKKYAAAPKPAVPVSGAGQRPQSQPARIKTPHLATVLFGLNESKLPLPDETAEEFKERLQRRKE